jgi:hypothetical protein
MAVVIHCVFTWAYRHDEQLGGREGLVAVGHFNELVCEFL